MKFVLRNLNEEIGYLHGEQNSNSNSNSKLSSSDYSTNL